jgi:hypothetical protein
MEIKFIEGKKESVIGRRIKLVYSKDSTFNKAIKPGDTGTIMDVYIIGRGKIMYSIDWDNENSLPLVEGEDDFEMVKSNNTVIDIEFR